MTRTRVIATFNRLFVALKPPQDVPLGSCLLASTGEKIMKSHSSPWNLWAVPTLIRPELSYLVSHHVRMRLSCSRNGVTIPIPLLDRPCISRFSISLGMILLNRRDLLRIVGAAGLRTLGPTRNMDPDNPP